MSKKRYIVLSREWYEGRQNEVPFQSIHIEDHQFLPGERGKRFAAVLMIGFDGRPVVIDGIPRTGGYGLVDMRTGIMGLRVTTTFAHWRTEDGMMRTLSAILNGEVGVSGPAPASSRYQIRVELLPQTGRMNANLYDTQGRAAADARHLCSIPVGQTPAQHDIQSLQRVASALHHGTVDWKKIRRGEAGL